MLLKLRKKGLRNYALGIGLGLVGLSHAQADVSAKNGNFFLAFTDNSLPGGFEAKIERVYNSKSDFKGPFGFGWGNEYSVYLTISADASAVVHEYGAGAENRFSPAAFNAAELEKAVDELTKVAQKSGLLGSPDAITNYKTRLKSSASFRNDEWEKFRAQNKIQARTLANGTKLQSNRFSYQYITKMDNGYIRTFDSGKVEQFDLSGRLAKISDKNGNYINFTYGKDGHLEKLIDNNNRKMFFSFDNKGFISRVETEDRKVSEYQYNAVGELTYSKDAGGNVYTFKYDPQHNMTEVGYSDNTKLKMEYWGRDKLMNIKRVTARSGSMTDYDYETDKSDKGHTRVSIVARGADGKALSTSKYDYYVKNKADGEEWTYKMVADLDGDRTETTYNECCSMPLVIRHNGEETSFEYDTKGHVKKKTTPFDVTVLDYDLNVGKVSKVSNFAKGSNKERSWSQFEYDPKGNLKFAKDSRGRGVKLIYDEQGRIKTLFDQSGHQITFKYDANSKPLTITDPAVGSIVVQYSNSGEIKKVDTQGGRKIAQQVASSFQGLMDIIRPAGVTLSF